MKKLLKSKSFVNTLGSFLIAFAGVVCYSNSFLFIGEPTAPKSLLK